MMIIKGEVLAVGIAFILGATQVQAESNKCDLDGSYGYVYNGVSYDDGGAVEIAETGSFSVGSEFCEPDELCGTAKAVFRFSNFIGAGYSGPLWALVQLDFEGASGVTSVDPVDPCQGTVDFLATGVVIKSAPLNLVGFTFFVDQQRSIAYTVSGPKGEIVDLISTSPGSVLAGTAKSQSNDD